MQIQHNIFLRTKKNPSHAPTSNNDTAELFFFLHEAENPISEIIFS